MSSYIKAPQNAADKSARTKFTVDKSGAARQPVVENVDVAALEIDQSYELDCDPYNSTGQFLTDALKKKFEE
ncbi:MAG: hypothetical protein KJO09_06780 [Gammaproteobacteria bacterium]|mgnify:FL=1|nr:hypothetical protein [Gammaproteobacteria bacterium]